LRTTTYAAGQTAYPRENQTPSGYTVGLLEAATKVLSPEG